MSNALALATVMGVLSARVQSVLNAANATDAKVITTHPRDNAEPGVYLTLYHLTPHPMMRNADLPTRSAGGVTRTRPTLPLTLRILFSFVGDPATFEPEHLAGLILSDLHARPILGSDEIDAYIATLPADSRLRTSDLADQPEAVRLTPVPMESEELTRIWGLFDQKSFALSMGWEASVVLLEAPVAPASGRPVLSVGLATEIATAARLTAVKDAATGQPVVEADGTLVIEGSGLLSERSTLSIGSTRRALGPADLNDGALNIQLTSVPALTAGVQTVTVEHTVVVPGAAGTGERSGALSNALALMVRPRIDTVSFQVAAGGARSIRLATTPDIGAEQRAEIILTATSARWVGRTFKRTGNDVDFDATGLGAGTYEVQLVVDGAPTIPPLSGGVFAGATVTVP